MNISSAPVRRYAGREAGFTLVELLVVLIILGVLLGIAAVSYTGFRARSARITARANVRTMMPAVEAYHADNETYEHMTLTILRNEYDFDIDDSAATAYAISNLTPTSYCIQNRNNSWYAWSDGPSDSIHTDTASHC